MVSLTIPSELLQHQVMSFLTFKLYHMIHSIRVFASAGRGSIQISYAQYALASLDDSLVCLCAIQVRICEVFVCFYCLHKVDIISV